MCNYELFAQLSTFHVPLVVVDQSTHLYKPKSPSSATSVEIWRTLLLARLSYGRVGTCNRL